MQTGIANMLMWQRIKEERGVRVTSVHACIGKHIFCEERQHQLSTFADFKNYSTASTILLRVGEIFESSPLNQKGGSGTLIANLVVMKRYDMVRTWTEELVCIVHLNFV